MASKRRSVSIKDVAQEAGVSASTVSFVLNERGSISAETAARVRAAVAKLQYRPDQAGRSLASRRAQTIGLLLPQATEVSDEFFSLFLAGITDYVKRKQYYLVLLPSSVEPKEVEEILLGAFRSGRVDGLILMEVEADDSRVKLLYESHVPIVLFGRSDLDVSWVDVDNFEGGYIATAHLLKLGHRRIAHLAAPDKYLYAHLRRLGFEQAMKDALGHDFVSNVAQTDLAMASAYKAAGHLLETGHRPTAIFAASDVMARGVLRCAEDLGIRVPEQLSVVGFDDTPLAKSSTPALTSVSQGPYQIGHRVGELLIRRIEQGLTENELVRPELRPRASVAPLTGYASPTALSNQLRLKEGATFAILSSDGTIRHGNVEQGVFSGDTRLLSSYELLADGAPLIPTYVDSTSNQLTIMYVDQKSQATRRIVRTLSLQADRLRDRIEWHVFSKWPQDWNLELHFVPDFRDVFELRGSVRVPHGQTQKEAGPDFEQFIYKGQDDLTRHLRVTTKQEGARRVDLDHRLWEIDKGQTQGHLDIDVSWKNESLDTTVDAIHKRMVDFSPQSIRWPRIQTNNDRWNIVLDKSFEDLSMLLTDYGCGDVFMAGLPWYGTFFGRDAIISSYEILQFVPQVAVNTLITLAALQGEAVNSQTEEAPGKIVHEIRMGELANIGQIPFGKYFGSADATPLFIVLFVETWRRTGNPKVIEFCLPAAEAALNWINQQGSDSKGLHYFEASTDGGLIVQSWKDSGDSMIYRDGKKAIPPLAVAEIQGYVYHAQVLLADFYERAGQLNKAKRLRHEADRLQEKFHSIFWSKSRQYYAMAIDKSLRQLDVISSDAGHCLWSGIIPGQYRDQVVHHLMRPELFTGWGIRTLGSSEIAYDPFSYHRGSVWPHDTALSIMGMHRSGFVAEAVQVSEALMEAAYRLPGHRLPELFSGEQRNDISPVPYPYACAPQAWASAVPWLVIQILLGLIIDGVRRVLTLEPVLPNSVDWVTVDELVIETARVSVLCDGQKITVKGLPRGWKVKSSAQVMEV